MHDRDQHIDESPPTPLDAVRVIDMAEGRGETCGRFLADLGADVIRVEPRGGGASRAQAPLHDGVSLPFAMYNAGKRGVVADHTTTEGRDRLLRLRKQESRPGLQQRVKKRQEYKAENHALRLVGHQLKPSPYNA